MAAGQMTAAGWEGRLLSGQAFRADAAVGWLAGRAAVLPGRQGFPGLRVALDMSWALRPVAGIEELPAFEEGIAAALDGSTAAVLCQYDRERFDPVTLASVAGFHTRAVAAATYYADALLRICRQYAPPGIRIAGELDFQADRAAGPGAGRGGPAGRRHHGQHVRAGVHRRPLHADGRGRRPDHGVPVPQVTLRCLPEVAAGFARIGLAASPGIRLVAAGDR